MWADLKGSIKRVAGASGAVTIPLNAKIISMTVHATTAGSVAMWDQMGGTCTIPIPAATWWIYQPLHLNTTADAKVTPNHNITFTGTDSYFIEYTCPQGF